VFGIVQGGVHEDLRRAAAEQVSAAPLDGLAIGGTLGRDKQEMRGVIAMTARHLEPDAPRHLLGIGEPDDLVEGIGLGIDLFDCAVPTRLARHGTALAPLPESRFRFDVRRAELSADERPLVEGCPCPACGAHTRAYLHFLSRAEELTGVRLLVLHNLTYLERLVSGAREAIRGARFGAYRQAILDGTPPWWAAAIPGEP
jgi:queuine tRNA-ribosyltransferase